MFVWFRLSGVLLALLALAACESSPTPPSDPIPTRGFLVSPLDLPPGASGSAIDFHASGRVVGYVREELDDFKAGVLWEGTSIEQLWRIERADVVAQAVNGAGMVAGTVTTHGESSCMLGAFLADDITFFTDEICDDVISVHDMDETGRVVGDLGASGPAFLYEAGTVVELEIANALGFTHARAINDNGIIVGSALRANHLKPAFWTAEAIEGGFVPGNWGRVGVAVGINTHDVALIRNGLQGLDNAGLYDFRRDEEATLVGPLPAEALVIAINANGDVIGHDRPVDGAPFLLSADDVMYRVEDANQTWIVERLVALDDRGWILAEARREGTSDSRPVILQPE